MRTGSILLFALLFILNSCSNNKKTRSQVTSQQIDSIMKSEMNAWADAFKNKNSDEAISLFDTSANVMLIGSDSSEVFKGHEQISSFLKGMFAMPLSFSWQFKSIDVHHHEGTAWVYVDAILLVTENGTTARLPYRFVVIAIDRNNEWKWRLYQGSEPKMQ